MAIRVLVTGGCGFLGSHVCEFYRNRGDSVVAFDNLTMHELQRTPYDAARVRDYTREYLAGLGVVLITGDICDGDALHSAARSCDFIVHTAAQPAVTISIEDPELDVRTNVFGTFNVLSAARTFDLPVVVCSTIHTYGNAINETLVEQPTRYARTPATIDETHPPAEGTLTPLHASKRAGELYARAFIDTYQVRAAAFRLTGVYGPRQFGGEDHGWVANFVIRTLVGSPVTIYGNGKQVRDILFATDAAAAFHAFYERQRPGVYNIGGGMACAISLRECLDLIAEMTGRRPIVRYEPRRHADLEYFVCDTSKADRQLGWRAGLSPRDGLEQLIDWAREHIKLFSRSEVRS